MSDRSRSAQAPAESSSSRAATSDLPAMSPEMDQEDVGQPFVMMLPDDPASNKDKYLWAGLLALAVFVVFFPAAFGSQVWDDEHHVGVIPALASYAGLVKIWQFHGATPQYYPLTFTSFWVEHKIWHESMLGYHLDNFILHALSAIVVWRILRRLLVPGAWIAAMIWAIHPIQAESVCWISERKNVLSGLLFFVSVYFYLEFSKLFPGTTSTDNQVSDRANTVNNPWTAYGVSLLAFTLGLFAKTVICAMPAVMLVLLWWKGRKLLTRKTLLPLIPFFAIGLAMAAITVHIETAQNGTVGASGNEWKFSFVERLLIAGRGLWFYVGKLVWPAALTFSYPRPVPTPDAMGAGTYALQWGYVIAAIVLVAVLWLGRKIVGRGPLAAVLYYGLTLFPSLGFFNIYPMRYSFVADHFQYLSGLGLIVLAVVAIHHLLRRLGQTRETAIDVPSQSQGRLIWTVAIGLVVIASLSLVSWTQAHIYESPLTLYRDTVNKNPDSWMASDNLGIELLKRAEQEIADAQVLRLQGDTDTADNDVKQSGEDFAEAERLFRHVLQLNPAQFQAHNSLGLLYRVTGRWQEAETELAQAVTADDQTEKQHQITAPYVNYATVMAHNHPGMDVTPWLKKALALSGNARVRSTDLAMVHLEWGDYLFHKAGADSPDTASLAERNDLQAAVHEFETGLRGVEDDVQARFSLARAYERLGLIDQELADRARAAGDLQHAAAFADQSLHVDDKAAMANFQQVIQNTAFGRHAGALNGMGEITLRHAVEYTLQSDALQQLIIASKEFQNALEIDPQMAQAKKNLAYVVQAFVNEAHKDKAHAAMWDVAQQQLQSLLGAADAATHASAGASMQALTAAAKSADAAIEQTMWPMPRDHALRDPMLQVRQAIADELDAITTNADKAALINGAKHIQDATQGLLDKWKDRDAGRDAVTDAQLMTLAFGGELDAMPNDPKAWNDLKSASDALTDALAHHADVLGAADLLKRTQSTLDYRKSATQPATQP